MKMDSPMVESLDRQMLLDFYSLGAWVHQYTATALYHEAQQIPTDKRVSPDDRPRIQMVLRAKIVAEAVSSFETLGRFCFAVRNRGKSGISSRFINMKKNRANDFYRLCTSNDKSPESLLRLQDRRELRSIVSPYETDAFFEQLEELLPNLAEAYLDDIEEVSKKRRLTRAYNAIKHGSHIINNIVELSPIHVSVEMGYVPIVTRWPKFGEEINDNTMIFITRSMSQESVTEDLEFIRQIAIVLSNLAQLLILLIDRNELEYFTDDDSSLE
ncbi:hypothetical protein [Sulfoacidibacillus ferrooxidans]|uniref:Uncharacterized protein n=1 Tax=Sulfoacidibacillus ferrooxidans TaxID=2005001 RepID=A0A9X1VAU0_9BACL|nr:hypothetical protein [Sulfoacidibacillus ferrooxidans]MCI0184846.1 hypothetical protein [Sulfoacidibacillus ferrooxidans]